MTTRRQHYVAQMHLESWATPKGKARQLWCLRRGARTPFQSDTKNVAVEVDFYRLTRFFKDDVQWVKSLRLHYRGHKLLRDLNERWINLFEEFWELQELRTAFPCATELIAELDRQLIEYQENYFSSQESDGIAFLRQLRDCDNSFFLDEKQAVSFTNFLMSQYFRTKKINAEMRKQFSGTDIERFDRAWPILRNIIATNVGWTVYANRQNAPLQVMRAPAAVRFITCDQPIINTHAAFLPETTPLSEAQFELYYPLSPTHAAIISSDPIYKGIHGEELSPFRVQYLNQAIEQVAHEQLFAAKEEDLQSLAMTFRK